MGMTSVELTTMGAGYRTVDEHLEAQAFEVSVLEQPEPTAEQDRHHIQVKLIDKTSL